MKPSSGSSGNGYEEQVPAQYKGHVGWYTVKVEHPDDALRVSKAIDSEFANSPFETHTDTEKAFAAGWVKQFGNIQFLIMAIGGVVFFTLLLVTGNTMAIAVRERTGELAVLKAVGYSDRFVLLFVLVESLLIAVIGGALGLGLAKLFTLGGDPTRGLLPFFFPARQSNSGWTGSYAGCGRGQRSDSGDRRNAVARSRRAAEGVTWRFLLFTTCAA